MKRAKRSKQKDNTGKQDGRGEKPIETNKKWLQQPKVDVFDSRKTQLESQEKDDNRV